MKLKFNTYGCNYETYLHVIITHVCKPSKRWLPQSRSILSEREYLTIRVFKELMTKKILILPFEIKLARHQN